MIRKRELRSAGRVCLPDVLTGIVLAGAVLLAKLGDVVLNCGFRVLLQ